MHGLLYRVRLIFAFSVLVIWNALPAECETPVKVTSVMGTGRRHRLVELERV